MKAAWYEQNGSASQVLNVGDLPDPVPSAGEVCVKVLASGVNPSDVKTRAGRPLVAPRVTPHSDGAGIIVSVGDGVAQTRVGERVWIWNGQWKRAAGTAAEFIKLPSEQAVILPEDTTFEEGACLGIPALTALRAVTIDGPVLGQTVLVSGGAGAVGAYAIQFARLLGAAVIIATVSSSEKASVAMRLGADHAINYRAENVEERVKQITDSRGADRVIEVDGAANSGMLPGLVARGGLCVIYGSGKPQVPFDFGPMIQIGAAVRFFVVYELPIAERTVLVNALNAYLSHGMLEHTIAARYRLDDIVNAHEAVESGTLLGNAVVVFDVED
ncbi:NADPH:quinone reductase [Caballeronia sp. LZ035]|uniref:NADPH:quinone reductase n=1 Tax=Caballeronia sp. LZ035 TaxID=3038568 RepID=UPI00285E933D|nr:NADPH:quinone reductase [Caballeronia sp. LZ035]MDR5759078.1 NADPH:quinone reductase [Caballeronia sp. LZ035]